MAGIDINNGVVNAGGMPSIFAGLTPPSVGAYSIWLDTSTNSLNYWNGGGWTAIGSISAIPNLEEVLEAGNTAVTDAIFNGSSGVYAGDYPLIPNSQQSFFTKTYNGQQIADGSGKSRAFAFVQNPSVSNRPLLYFSSNVSGVSRQMLIIPPDITSNVSQNLVEADGNIYPGQHGTVTLVAGIGQIIDTSITSSSTITFATKSGSGTLGVTYQGVITAGVGVVVTSLKTNNTTELSDLSTLYYQIWHSK